MTTEQVFAQMQADYKSAMSELTRLKEPSKELSDLTTALDRALEEEWSSTSPEFRAFLHNDLAPGLAEKLYKERSSDKLVSLVLSIYFCVVFGYCGQLSHCLDEILCLWALQAQVQPIFVLGYDFIVQSCVRLAQESLCYTRVRALTPINIRLSMAQGAHHWQHGWRACLGWWEKS